jgi:hypothetical protein
MVSLVLFILIVCLTCRIAHLRSRCWNHDGMRIRYRSLRMVTATQQSLPSGPSNARSAGTGETSFVMSVAADGGFLLISRKISFVKEPWQIKVFSCRMLQLYEEQYLKGARPVNKIRGGPECGFLQPLPKHNDAILLSQTFIGMLAVKGPSLWSVLSDLQKISYPFLPCRALVLPFFYFWLCTLIGWLWLCSIKSEHDKWIRDRRLSRREFRLPVLDCIEYFFLQCGSVCDPIRL